MSTKAPNNEIKKADNKTYSQDWASYNQAQTQEKLIFLELLHDLVSQIPRQNNHRRGRPSVSIDDMIFCCCLKTYLDFSSRRTSSDIKLAYNLGYIDHTPHFNTVLNYFNKAEMRTYLIHLIHLSALPLKDFEKNFVVDATGFSTSMFGRWADMRYLKNEVISRRLWVKCHIMSGAKTNVITHVEITNQHVNDSIMFPNLVDNTAMFFNMERISGDRAYSSRRNLHIAIENGAIPYILFKKNTRSSSKGYRIWRIMHHYFKDNEKEFLEHYHLRSNVESTFSMIKRKFGDNLRTKNATAIVNEILCKVLVHNICVLIQEMFELGIKVDFEDGALRIFCAEQEKA